MEISFNRYQHPVKVRGIIEFIFLFFFLGLMTPAEKVQKPK